MQLIKLDSLFQLNTEQPLILLSLQTFLCRYKQTHKLQVCFKTNVDSLGLCLRTRVYFYFLNNSMSYQLFTASTKIALKSHLLPLIAIELRLSVMVGGFRSSHSIVFINNSMFGYKSQINFFVFNIFSVFDRSSKHKFASQ